MITIDYMMKIRILALAVLAASLAGCGKTQKTMLDTAPVTVEDISESVTATGTVESVTSVDVGTQVTGIIDKIYVDYNSQVKQGDLIAEIEKTLLESELKSAEASVESARVTYEYNRTNYERDRNLHERRLISDYEFDTSSKEYQVSKTAYEKAKADRVRAAKNLNYAQIYSPIDGVVISRDVEVGQTVVSSMTVANLFTIADLENMQVVADVDEADIGRVQGGTTCHVHSRRISRRQVLGHGDAGEAQSHDRKQCGDLRGDRGRAKSRPETDTRTHCQSHDNGASGKECDDRADEGAEISSLRLSRQRRPAAGHGGSGRSARRDPPGVGSA